MMFPFKKNSNSYNIEFLEAGVLQSGTLGKQLVSSAVLIGGENNTIVCFFINEKKNVVQQHIAATERPLQTANTLWEKVCI